MFIFDPLHRMMRSIPCGALLMYLLLAGACTPDHESGRTGAVLASPELCGEPERIAPLPPLLEEASGIAASRTHAGVLWVINDSDPHIYALDRTGRELGRVRVPVKVRDWEDLAIAECGEQDCLYIGEFGDNQHHRSDVAILRIPEPDPSARTTAAPERFSFRYPDGPRDAEALFILPGERLHIVSKGRNGPVALYRFPPLDPGDVLTLTHLRDFTPGLVQAPDMVTGAAAMRSGRWVAIRTYSFVDLYPVRNDTLALARAARIPLSALGERQGEGVALTDAGELFLVSEHGFGSNSAPLSRIRCTLD